DREGERSRRNRNPGTRRAPPGRQAVEGSEDDPDCRATCGRLVDVHRPRKPDDVEEDVHEQETGGDDAPPPPEQDESARARGEGGQGDGEDDQPVSTVEGPPRPDAVQRQDPPSLVSDLLRRLVDPERDDESPQQQWPTGASSECCCTPPSGPPPIGLHTAAIVERERGRARERTWHDRLARQNG